MWIGTGSYENNIKKWIHERDLEGKVILTGIRSDVNKLMSAMDVFIMPSYYEGFGISLIEAQTNGLTCFASDRVPREVDVTGNVNFLSLDDYNVWANSILDCQGDLRKDDYGDMKEVSSIIEKKYTEIMGER